MNPHPVEASLEIAAERVGDLTPLVYERLFRLRPDLQRHFILDKDGEVRGHMLSHAIMIVLDVIGERRIAQMFVQTESMNHAGYGVPPEQFDIFFPTMAATVRDVVGPDWTGEMAAAWDVVLEELASFVCRD